MRLRILYLMLALSLLLASLAIGGSARPGRDLASAQAPATSGAYPIVDTGQTKCYDEARAIACPGPSEPFFGQDAQITGRAPSYSLDADGLVVHDNVTGLSWQRSPETNGDGVLDSRDKLTWSAAQARPAALNAARFGGYDDWRLPTIKELYSLIDFRGTDPRPESPTTSGLIPFIDTAYFDFVYGDLSAGERVIDSQYASSTLYVANRGMLFGVNFADGRIKGYGLRMPGGSEKTFFVLCVRGNPDYGTNSFVDNGDGTVSDQATGLMWSKSDSGSGMNWQEALAWVQAQNAALYLGHDDWRLPNAKELQSIVDYSRSPDTSGSAAIDPVFETSAITNESCAADYPWYWSSTTHANAGGAGSAGAYVCFGRSMGYMQGGWVDVHGAGAQRSDPKGGSLSDYEHRDCGYYNSHAPQGDAIRIGNDVRLVRTIGPAMTATPTATSTEMPGATSTPTASSQPTVTPTMPPPSPTSPAPERRSAYLPWAAVRD